MSGGVGSETGSARVRGAVLVKTLERDKAGVAQVI